MTHTLKRTFAVLLLAIFGSTILYNCEPDPDSLGEQLFNQDAAQGKETPYELIAYNIDNHDSIRSDASRLINLLNTQGTSTSIGVLGAFTENKFGMQKASYLTQLRMPTDNFDFNGPNAKVDSVVLVLRMPANTADDTYYLADSLKAPGAYDNNDFLIGNEKVPVSIEKKTYPVRKYGKIGGSSNSMKINVHEITTFIDPSSKTFMRSNVSVSTGALLGSAVFDGNVSSVTVTKKSDNSNVFTGNLGFRMQLDKDFFQTRIIDKKGKPELQDAANFIRYFKGIKISADETDKYLFQFSANDMELIMYYKYDKTDNGVVTRPQTSLAFNLGAANAHIGQYEYNRTGSEVAEALKISSADNGDSKLYVQGMGGPSIGIKIPESTINALKDLYQKDKAGIVSAKIRLYVDPETWSNKHSVAGDRKFTILPADDKKGVDGELVSSAFTPDLLAGFTMYYYNKSPEYYDFVVTKTVKDIVETAAANKTLLINPGSFVKNSSGSLLGPKYTTRAFDMNRTIFTGSLDKTNANRAQLRVIYATKKN
ncbi:DUF4270 domain-containing protein [Chryseobacterium gallinarum]|uniref:DUF4270 family protein n=1 Tax=Chryseobacterium gallinarum TaxID=1324352 RepID=UPI002025ABB3|nr:DUF4270 family protein [Chryseobacterium gallinarum]MCL8536959.1 DUF4270 domain-containing protein [Chryseobacterium gallinarum]